jgi:hypothetical protein
MPYPICFAPGCTRPVRSRGLCWRHYWQLRQRVQRDEVTWEQLEAAGACLPVRRTPWRDGRRWRNEQGRP